MSFNNNIIFNRLLNDIGINVERENKLNNNFNINKLNISKKINELNDKKYFILFIYFYIYFFIY